LAELAGALAAGFEPLLLAAKPCTGSATDLAGEIRHFAPWAEAEPPPCPPRRRPAKTPPAGKTCKRKRTAPTLEALATLRHRWEAPGAGGGRSEFARRWSDWLPLASARRRRIARTPPDRRAVHGTGEHDLDFLYDADRKLLSIGYNLDARKRDPSFYDLLASECRLGSFIGVARGLLPLEHWFRLGRRLAPGGGRPCWRRGAARCSNT
jgi:hypothetical protein